VNNIYYGDQYMNPEKIRSYTPRPYESRTPRTRNVKPLLELIRPREQGTSGEILSGQWREKAFCNGLPAEVFYGNGDFTEMTQAEVHRAKAICQNCVVMEECRDYAIAAREGLGVWGGMTSDERRVELGRRLAEGRQQQEQ